MFRVNSIISEPVSNDGIGIIDGDLDSEPNSSINEQSLNEESLKFTDTDKLLSHISLVGVSTLALIGTLFAFNGPIVLIKFFGLGLVALIGCLSWITSSIGRLVHWVIMFVLSFIYFFVAIIVTRIAARVLARPIVSIFHIHGTDDPDDDGMLARQPEQNDSNQQPPSEPQAQNHSDTTTTNSNEQSERNQDSSRPDNNTGDQNSQQNRQSENQASFAPKASEWNPLD